jgi:hypothetical protein
MTEIFFSYSSKDRDRVKQFRDALVEQGFDVFWDQSVPTGTDWDTWIRQYLNQAKSVVVFWSNNSITSKNVRHEATVADRQNKLIPILLDVLSDEQFPMGLIVVQCANLAAWSGDTQDSEWVKLQRQIEAKLTPPWVRNLIDALEAKLHAEQIGREEAERRHKALRDRTATNEQSQAELVRERDQALDGAEILKTRLEAVTRERTELRAKLNEMDEQRQALVRRAEEAERETRHEVFDESAAKSPAKQATTDAERAQRKKRIGTVAFWITLALALALPLAILLISIARK